MLRGGGKSFGPHPRDFATGLPRKMYDLAWRTALSYRYRRGELIVLEDGVELESGESELARSIFQYNRWGNENGRSLVITEDYRENFFEALEGAGEHGRALTEDEVDVKDLLEMGRIIIEKAALDNILENHQSDIAREVAKASGLL
jgi:large subunit ribosomal protein L4